jgi:hypothetical protein
MDGEDEELIEGMDNAPEEAADTVNDLEQKEEKEVENTPEDYKFLFEIQNQRLRSIEKKLDDLLKSREGKDNEKKSLINPINIVEDQKKLMAKKISAIIELSQSQDFEIALEKIEDEAQEILKILTNQDNDEKSGKCEEK